MSLPRSIIPAPCEPISLSDAKAQLRLDSDITADDTLIRQAIAAARRYIEAAIRRKLVLTTSRDSLSGFPNNAGIWPIVGAAACIGWGGAAGGPTTGVIPNPHIDDAAIRIYGGPLQSVLSVRYLDTAGTLQTLATTAYTVDAEDDPARLMPGTATVPADWPDTLTGQLNVVTVTYASGYMTPFTAASSSDLITLAAGAAALEAGQAIRLTAIDGALPAGLAERTNYYALAAGTSTQLSLTPGGSAVDITDNGTAGTYLIDACPEAVKQALKMTLTFFYENRGDLARGDMDIPEAVESLLSPFKVWRF